MRHTGAASWCNSTVARAGTSSPVPCTTASAANCASATARARKTSSARLGLAVNVVVLWNTIYMDAALNQLRAEGFDVRDEDVARLSPLGFEHINMLGRYAFTLPDAVARGELRPLRNPAAHGNDADEPALT